MNESISKIKSLLIFYKQQDTEIKFRQTRTKGLEIVGKIKKVWFLIGTPYVIVGDMKIFLEDIDFDTIMPSNKQLEIKEEPQQEVRVMVRTSIGQKKRFEVFQRDNHTCRYCGKKSLDGVQLEVDHIIPVASGGTDELSNLITACFDCNRGKGALI